jgi:hypothetical protein
MRRSLKKGSKLHIVIPGGFGHEGICCLAVSRLLRGRKSARNDFLRAGLMNEAALWLVV